MREEHHETFHGRELGYMYRETEAPSSSYDSDEPRHFDWSSEEPEYGIRHGETFGAAHKAADKYETQYGELARKHWVEQQKERYVEPMYSGEKEGDHDLHFEPPQHHPREVEYEIDEYGHVHEYEETPQYYHSYLQ